MLREISLQTTKATFDSWLTGTSLLRLEDGEALIGVRNKYAKEWLETRSYNIIKRSIDPFLPAPVELKFVIIEKAS